MENYDLEIKRIKRKNYIVFGIFAGLILAEHINVRRYWFDEKTLRPKGMSIIVDVL